MIEWNDLLFQGGDLDQPKIKIKTDIFKPDDLHRQDKPIGKFYGLFSFSPQVTPNQPSLPISALRGLCKKR